MPEIVTKHPEMMLQFLKDKGMKCGQGQKQQILITCPKEKFCSYAKGEICVYGVKDIPQMTQISGLEIFAIPSMLFPLAILLIMVFLLGTLVGIKISKPSS